MYIYIDFFPQYFEVILIQMFYLRYEENCGANGFYSFVKICS